MPGKHLYEYAVIRIVPRVDREEFINAGIILYCKSLKCLCMRFLLDAVRLNALFPRMEVADVEAHLQSIEKVCCGGAAGGPIGALDMASRFRWVTATRSTVVQSSRIHAGLCDDPQLTMNALFDRLVMPASATAAEPAL